MRLTAGESSDPDADSDGDTDAEADADSAGTSGGARGSGDVRGHGASAVSSEEIAEAKKALAEQEKAANKPTNHYPEL